MDALKKCKVVTYASGVAAAALLGLTVYAASTAVPKETSNVSTVNIQLDADTYKGVMGMLDYYRNHDISKDPQFVSEGDRLYIVFDGNKYPVVDTEDGLVAEGTLTDDAIGTLDADDNEIVGITDDGLPIIGYDDLGNAIIGRTDEAPIEDIVGDENVNILVDENGNRYYHIVWGDTLCKISSLTHYSVDELAEYNHIRNVNLIYAESDLMIPDKK